jgi:hypothetical protein
LCCGYYLLKNLLPSMTSCEECDNDSDHSDFVVAVTVVFVDYRDRKTTVVEGIDGRLLAPGCQGFENQRVEGSVAADNTCSNLETAREREREHARYYFDFFIISKCCHDHAVCERER